MSLGSVSAFDRQAPLYHHHAALQRTISNWMIEICPADLPNGVILDAGCGAGDAMNKLNKKYLQREIIALDASMEMLRCNKDKMFKRLQSRLPLLPLQSASVALLVSSMTLQWVSHPAIAAQQFYRVLAPGGLAIVSIPVTGSLTAWYAFLKQHGTMPRFRFPPEAIAANWPGVVHIEQRRFTQMFQGLNGLLTHVRGIGGTGSNTTAPPLPKSVLHEAKQHRTPIKDGYTVLRVIMHKPCAD